ncbi:MAG TPA: Holliday junction branch migration protein RuvA [Actinomycetota bacterium]|nr:Holliday junction branch migration protein RuvA [Actinomycetota bacterium]
MISSLKGSVTDLSDGTVEVDVNGVGYQVACSTRTISTLRVGKVVRLAVQTIVREDSISLYGFASADERELFKVLLSVNGLGAKIALTILGSLDETALRGAIASDDVELLVTVPGIGKRTAQRMIVELKGRLGAPESDEASDPRMIEAREALASLGYETSEVRSALAGLDDSDLQVEQMVKQALKGLARA